MSVLKVLFINPPYTLYGGVEGQGGKNTPLNLAYLASYLREHKSNLDVKIIDAEGLDLTFAQLLEEVDGYTPHIVGITCPTAAYYNIRKICHDLKQQDSGVKVVLGGSHPTALPQETIAETGCDAVVIGEGEITFFDLLEAWEKGLPLEKVRGIAFRDRSSGEIVVTPARELIQDLDIVPFPAKDLLPIHKYFLPPTKRIRSERATNMVTSRGCPYNCRFCMAQTMWTRKTRLRSVRNVLDEIRVNVEHYRLNEFSFHDEVFTLKRDRAAAICEGILQAGWDITWVCMARVEAVDLELLKLMKRAGCGKIGFGFESGSPRMLELMNKRMNLADAIQAAALCKKAGIEVVGNFVLGYPGENVQSIKETIAFAKQVDCDTAAFFIAIPYPGTQLWFEAKEKGYLKDPIDWREFAPVSALESPLILPGLSPRELEKWKKKAYYRFYLRPHYLLKRLQKIRSSADMVDLIRGLKIFKNVT
jgi:anaerobic magnesium-protoporphyrin IX monomethyl ester cyclase